MYEGVKMKDAHGVANGLEPDFAGMAEKAEEAARLLASLAHGKRLMALCHMLQGEKS
eukprot:gene6978-8668_t